MEKINVTGMSCAACSARVEKAIREVDGITSCNVNLLTGVASFEGDASLDTVKAAVIHAGYGIGGDGEETIDDGTDNLRLRLILSAVITLPVMYMCFVLDSLMWLQGILAFCVIFINRAYFDSGIKAVMNRAPNMDTLVTLGSLAGFFSMHFDCSAMILTLITIGKYLEARNKGKATDALKGLIDMTPETARVVRDGKEQIISARDVVVGDVFIVKPGEAVPVDGSVIDGKSSVNESALTGESIPVDKKEGDAVSQATLNTWGVLECSATRVGSDSTLSQVIKMVQDATATKAPSARLADRVAGIFVPVVIGLACLTFAVWMIINGQWEHALDRAIAVLVISCPCALGLATPVAIMAGSGKGARNGILFKTARALEDAGRVDTVCLDKTGTITKGEPEVTDISGNERLLEVAYALESLSEHPLAKAVTMYAEGSGMDNRPTKVKDFEIMTGSGVRGIIDGKQAVGASYEYFKDRGHVIDEAEAFAAEGKTPMVFALDDEILGVIAVRDEVKEDSREAISDLRDMGIRVIMLTGDNEKTATAIARQAGVTDVYAGLKPEDKTARIRELKETGNVAMVGDGINDAPALTESYIGMAIGAGSDIAIDAGDIVLMKSRLTDVSAALRLGRATLRNIKQNIGWAFGYNIIGIPIAAGLFGIEFNPAIAAACMSVSSVCVVTNALRINRVKLYNRKEKKTMEKTINVKGMMCVHCEANVKKALENVPGVTEAVTSHEKGTAVITMDDNVDEKLLVAAIEGAGYEVA